MSKTDTLLLLNAATAILLPFSYSWVKARVFPDWVRFCIACLISGLIGTLTAYNAGTLSAEYSIVQNAATVVVGSYVIYYSIFRGLKLEDWLFPRAMVIEEAQKSVAAQIGILSSETIKQVTDPEVNSSIVVTAEQQDITAANGPVIPKG